MRSKESLSNFFDYDVHLESSTIYIGDEGDDQEITHVTARNVIKAIHILDDISKPITIYLNSFGGCFYSGMAIHDVIKAAKNDVTVYCLGAVMSAGSIILQAADQRVSYPNTSFMLHDGSDSIIDAPPQSLQNWAEHGKKSLHTMYRIYAERSNKPISFWKRKCAADLVLTAPEALSLGLIDSIFA